MISLCFTTWNRDSLLFEAFRHVVNDERVSEIVIVDDCSQKIDFKVVEAFCESYEKVRLYRNKANVGCYQNKAIAISKAHNEWVAILDSDNIFRPDYLDKLFRYNTQHGWKSNTILAPDFAQPTFDYRHFSGHTITKQNVSGYAKKKRFDCLINTANYFVNRDEYLRVFDKSIEPWTADTMYQNRNWLVAGNQIHVLQGLQYEHRIHPQSHYQQFNHKTNGLDKIIMNEFKWMK